jgi:hypothetical protein
VDVGACEGKLINECGSGNFKYYMMMVGLRKRTRARDL